MTMRKIEDDLRKMGAAVTDKDFLDILMTSLPESWDTFTNMYMTANATGINKITSQEFISAVNDELSRQTAHETKSDTALKAYLPASRPANGTCTGGIKGKCYNCSRPGHKKEDCWVKGGGKEGQGPVRGRQAKKGDTANKADANSSDIELAYMAIDSFDMPGESSRDAWWLDLCANRHV
jgi:hypothetical protein